MVRSRSTALTLAVCFSTLVLAGCTGGEAASQGGPVEPSSAVVAEGDAIPDAGSIEGSVVDDAVVPLHGAQVAVLDLNLVAVTDAAGLFAFSNLSPGTYKVAAAALGYTSAAKAVEVVANEPAHVTFSLTRLAVKEGWVEIIGPIAGFVNCTFGTPIVAGICPGTSTVFPNEKSSFNYQMHNETTDLVGEIRWQPASFGTSKVLGLTFSYRGRMATHWWCLGSGTSPVKWHYVVEDGSCNTTGRSQQQVPSGSPQKPNATMTLNSFVTIPFTQVGNTNDPFPAHVAVQQKVEVVFSIFQDLTPGETYTAFPDV